MDSRCVCSRAGLLAVMDLFHCFVGEGRGFGSAYDSWRQLNFKVGARFQYDSPFHHVASFRIIRVDVGRKVWLG